MKKRKQRDLLKGMRVNISHHALKRCLIRTEEVSLERYEEMEALAKDGDKDAIDWFEKKREKMERKFRNTTLAKFGQDGVEIRRETMGSKKNICTFVAKKKGRTFIVITAYLQGRREDFWKINADKGERQIG